MTHALTASEIRGMPDGTLVDVVEKRWYGPRGGRFWYGIARTREKRGDRLYSMPMRDSYLPLKDYRNYEFRLCEVHAETSRRH